MKTSNDPPFTKASSIQPPCPLKSHLLLLLAHHVPETLNSPHFSPKGFLFYSTMILSWLLLYSALQTKITGEAGVEDPGLPFPPLLQDQPYHHASKLHSESLQINILNSVLMTLYFLFSHSLKTAHLPIVDVTQ